MILVIPLGLIAAFLPRFFFRLREQKYKQLLSRQLRLALQSMVHALRIGVSFLQDLEWAAKEGEEPLAQEWRTTLQAVQVGKTLPEALRDLQQRVPLKDMEWFVTAVCLTQSTGGSLSEVLETLAQNLQERETLREKVAALTAQGKASGALLGALPFLLLLALEMIAPELVHPMFSTSLGQMMLGGVMMGVAIGGWVIHRIVTIPIE